MTESGTDLLTEDAIVAAIRARYAKVKATTYRAGTPAEAMKDGVLQGLNTALAIAMIEADRRPPSPDLSEVKAVLGVMIAHWENGDDHNEGAFDADCPDCVILDRARSLLAKLEGVS